MKIPRFERLLAFMLLLSIPSILSAQVTIWTDNFNNGCASDCIANTWNGWTILDNDGGTTGGAPNNWFISCAEEGITPPGCGSSCIGDASLHIGANPGAGGDMGASFNETGVTNATFRTAVSPTISSVGYSGITLTFDFIAFGSAGCSDDRLQLRLSTDNGATWPAGYQYCLTSVCCGACNGYSQGQWTTYSLALPAAFDNNPNIRVGYNWRNNGNGSGTDPSAAIDDVRLTTPVPMATTLLNFTAETDGTNGININWKATNEEDFSHYDLERSSDGTTFSKINSQVGKCTGSDICKYSYKDVNHSSIVYYRLKMVDKNEHFRYSSVAVINPLVSNTSNYELISCSSDGGDLNVKISAKKKTTAKFVVYNLAGVAVLTREDQLIKSGTNDHSFTIGKLSKGVYILKVYTSDDKVLSGKFIIG